MENPLARQHFSDLIQINLHKTVQIITNIGGFLLKFTSSYPIVKLFNIGAQSSVFSLGKKYIQYTVRKKYFINFVQYR
jgi:hypothetical protein